MWRVSTCILYQIIKKSEEKSNEKHLHFTLDKMNTLRYHEKKSNFTNNKKIKQKLNQPNKTKRDVF